MLTKRTRKSKKSNVRLAILSIMLLAIFGVAIATNAFDLERFRECPVILPQNGVITANGSSLRWNIEGDTLYLHGGTGVTLNTAGFRSPWEQHGEAIGTVVFTGPVVGESSLANLFANLPRLRTIQGLELLDVSNVEDMHGMFYSARHLAHLDVSNWNTANVRDMSFMFHGVISQTELDVSGWNTENVTNMRAMFQLTNISELDVSNWNTQNVEDMSWMFTNSTTTAKLDVGRWNTGNVTNMRNMFRGVARLEELDVSNWNVSNVRNMSGMFLATSMPKLNLSRWNTQNVENMEGIFEHSTRLNVLHLGAGFATPEGENGRWSLSTLFPGKGWRNVGSGTIEQPEGEFFLSSEELNNRYVNPATRTSEIWVQWWHFEMPDEWREAHRH